VPCAARGFQVLLALLCCFAARGAAPLGIALNEDDSHFFGLRPASAMTLEGLHAFIDQYAGTHVSHLFLCPNAQKASYRSAVWDAVWDITGTQRQPEDGVPKTWLANARLLHERGLDPYAVWIARCREKGISPWLSMRMNDVHNVDDVDSYIHASFWREHPEYWRVPGSTGAWTDRAFDFGIAEVRAHHMALVKELLERYDADGIELDWMRFGYHFKPGQEAAGAALLTQFMRDARALTKAWSEKRGHPVLLGARVPTDPVAAKGLGMDAIRWAQEGLIDRLVPTPFWATADFDIPMERWREQLGDTAKSLVLCAGTEILLRAHPGGPAVENDLASARGFALAHLHRGADQIYLFNYMDPEPMQGPAGSYQALLRAGFKVDTLARLPRRHPVTYRDTVAPGMPNGAALPADAKQGAAFSFYIGPKPDTGSALLVFGAAAAAPEGTTFALTVNGAAISAETAPPPHASLPGAQQILAYSVPVATLKEGHNTVHIQQGSGETALQLVWVELNILP
jgi:hypothetical protein